MQSACLRRHEQAGGHGVPVPEVIASASDVTTVAGDASRPPHIAGPPAVLPTSWGGIAILAPAVDMPSKADEEGDDGLTSFEATTRWVRLLPGGRRPDQRADCTARLQEVRWRDQRRGDGLPELARHRRLATPTTTNANGIFCINATSSSGNHFYYNSKIGGLTTTACPTDQ